MSKALSILSKDRNPILLQLSRNVQARAAEARRKLDILLLLFSALKSHKSGLGIQYVSRANKKIVFNTA